MKIRNAEPADAIAIATIYVGARREAWRDLVDHDWLDALDVAREAESFGGFVADPAEGWTITVAEAAGGVVGFCSSGPSDRPAYAPSVRCTSHRSGSRRASVRRS